MGVRHGTHADMTLLRRLTVDQVPLQPAVILHPQEPASRLVELLDDFFPVFEKKNNNKHAHRVVRRFLFAKPPGALAPFAKGLKNIGLAFLAFYGAPSLSFWTTQNDIETETIYNGLFALGLGDAGRALAQGDDNVFCAAVAQVQCVGMALRAVAENGHVHVLDQVDVAIAVIVNAHVLSSGWVSAARYRGVLQAGQRCALSLFGEMKGGSCASISICGKIMLDDVDRRILRQWQSDPTLAPAELAARARVSAGQLARRLGLPYRSAGSFCGSKLPDAQAAYETANSLNMGLLSGVNFMLHAAGWLEGGLIASPEKFIMDCEVLQHIQRYLDPVICETGPDEIAVDAIADVGNDGHFFGIQHTQERYETAFYQPFLSDWRNYEGWELAGGVWTAERAHKLFKQIIAEFEEPPMDIAIRQELGAVVERRKSEGGAPTDF